MNLKSTESATLQNVLRYEFHGILYFELHYIRAGAATAAGAANSADACVWTERVAAHIVYEHPKAGDRVEIERLMGMIHAVRRV
ncbi:MAG: hypothetical protein HY286_13980 [Planctomycetes bacterium]|nr:hypothetical protein [Planctomycetota bacterium]